MQREYREVKRQNYAVRTVMETLIEYGVRRYKKGGSVSPFPGGLTQPANTTKVGNYPMNTGYNLFARESIAVTG